MFEAAGDGRTTVVHIEADRANALLMQFLLGSNANYALHHASDGLSGLQLCQSVMPDLVITEMHLPDISAYEVLRALRDSATTAGMPCIVLSGDAMPSQIKRALASGFNDYWTKPIDVWQLMQKVDGAAVGECRRRWNLARRRQPAEVNHLDDVNARRQRCTN